jgi:hypothetical protein
LEWWPFAEGATRLPRSSAANLQGNRRPRCSAYVVLLLASNPLRPNPLRPNPFDPTMAANVAAFCIFVRVWHASFLIEAATYLVVMQGLSPIQALQDLDAKAAATV